MCKKPMCGKIYGVLVLLIALVLGFLVINVSMDSVDKVMMVIKFFDVMIPVLAVGALLKYVFCGGKSSCCCCCKDGSCGKNA